MLLQVRSWVFAVGLVACATAEDVRDIGAISGGVPAGGNASITGGATATGGLPATGGVPSTGGSTPTGGLGGSAIGGMDAAPGTGGTLSTGGAAGAAGTLGSGAGSGAGGAPSGAPPDNDCTSASFGGHAYWFCTANHNWDEARPLCQAVGGYLVCIGSPEEQQFITDTAGAAEWIIGLDQKNATGGSAAGTWEWVDGTDPTSYANWGSGEPDSGECGAMNADGTWKDFGCSNDENWICEIP